MKSIRIFSIKSIDIVVHPFMPLMILYAWISGHGAFIIITVISIVLHECAHALTAFLFRQKLQSIEITPLGAVLRMEITSGLSASKKLFILLSGPMMSWCLCAISIVAVRCGFPVEISWYFFIGNLAIFVLNLVPALPLDGGRVLLLILERLFPSKYVVIIMRSIGTVLGVTFIVLNIVCVLGIGGWNLSLGFAGFSLLHGTKCEMIGYQLLEYRRLLDRKISIENKGFCAVCVRYVLSHIPLRYIIRRLPASKSLLCCCLEPGTMNLLGYMTEIELIQIYMLHPDMTLRQALEMRRFGIDRTKYGTN